MPEFEAPHPAEDIGEEKKMSSKKIEGEAKLFWGDGGNVSPVDGLNRPTAASAALPRLPPKFSGGTCQRDGLLEF